jgi:hypothetical protein
MTETKKYAIFAFRGEGPCFLHAILNAEDMRKKGFESIVIMEGGSVKFIKPILDGEFSVTLDRLKKVVDCACLGCSKMFKVDGLFDEAGIRLEGGMGNHVSIIDYIRNGFEIIII